MFMDFTRFTEIIENQPAILGEGAVIERLRRDSGFELDSHLINSAFVYEEAKRLALADIYQQYLAIGFQYDLPLMLSTPTWRASRQRIEAAGYASRDVNGDNFRFLDQLRRNCGRYAEKVMIGGLLSCRGDAYSEAHALSTADARRYHSWQAAKLADAGVDFLWGATLPAIGEATGLAFALADTGKPYIISFVFRPEGTLLDGTPLSDAINTIDGSVNPKPAAYMANCTHASFFKKALMNKTNSSSLVRQRVIGLMANTAALKPEELDDSDSLIEEDPEVFGDSMTQLHIDFGMKILGGCCGTDDRHIRSLAIRIFSHIGAK
jgi:homocysteine S-methyltransferase